MKTPRRNGFIEPAPLRWRARFSTIASSLLDAVMLGAIAFPGCSKKPAPKSVRYDSSKSNGEFAEAAREGRMASIKLMLEGGDGVPPGLLTTAAENGQVEVIHALIAAGADPNEQDNSNGWTPLIRAAFMNRLDSVKALVEAGADINRLDDEGRNAAWLATYFAAAPDTLQYLIDREIALDTYDKRGNTLLIEMMNYVPRRAVLSDRKPRTEQEMREANDRERRAIDILARAGVDLNQPSAEGTSLAMGTPLMEALHGGQYEFARALLDHNVNIFTKDKLGNTALSCLLGGHGWGQPFPVDIVERLLKAEADPNCTYLYPGQKPLPPPQPVMAVLLHQAGLIEESESRKASARGAIKLLLEHGAKFASPVAPTDVAVLSAAAKGNPDDLRSAIVVGGKIDARDGEGWTPLKVALALDRGDCVDWLLANGASPLSDPADANSPLWLAVSRNNEKLVRRFLDAGAKPTPGVAGMAAGRHNLSVLEMLIANGASGKGVNLYSSIQNGDLEIVRLLLDNGADPEGENFENRRNVFWTVYFNKPEILKLLLERGADSTLKTMYKETPLSEAQGRDNKECEAILQEAIAKRKGN